MHDGVRYNVGPSSFQESKTPQETVAIIEVKQASLLCQQRLEPKI